MLRKVTLDFSVANSCQLQNAHYDQNFALVFYYFTNVKRGKNIRATGIEAVAGLVRRIYRLLERSGLFKTSNPTKVP